MSLRSGDKLVLLTFSQDVDMGICSILKFSAKKVVFLVSSGKNQIFTTFGPLEKFGKNPLVALLEKVHGC